MEPRGIEPLTSALRTHGPASASDTPLEVMATPTAACTSACTSKPKNDNAGSLEALAAALLGLAPEDRARLAAILIQSSGEKSKADNC